MKRITSELEGLLLYLERRIGTLQHPEGNTHDLWRTNRNSPILLSLFRKVFFNILEKIYSTRYLVKLHQMLVATTGSTDRQNVNPLREPDPNLDILKKCPQLFCRQQILTSGPDFVFLHLTNMQQRIAMAMMTRTNTTAAAFPPSFGKGVIMGGSEESSTILLGNPGAGTAGTGVKARQTLLCSFTVGVRPTGQEQTVLPPSNVDVKVSGQAQVAVNELEEEMIYNLQCMQCTKNSSKPIKHLVIKQIWEQPRPVHGEGNRSTGWVGEVVILSGGEF